MSSQEQDYRYAYKVGPFYRKFLAGKDVWCEVNRDGKGGLWFHVGNSQEGSSKPVHFSSETQFLEFCTKLMGFEALENWEEIWKGSGI